jgi:3',5'-cyclic AMP phosphodiesterase CpdA
MAAEQLSSLGTPEEVFLIPGNHDCYVRVAPESSWDLWSDYLAGTSLSQLDSDTRACLVDSSAESAAPRHADYPMLRMHGDLAMIGLCSAIPTAIFRAGGRLGHNQLERLERLLIVLKEQNRCRVVMVHHPVAISGDSNRRALSDADELRAVLERAGAELVLHGHKHRRRVAEVAGPHGAIPVIGVPSSSEIGSRPDKRAQYHVYTARAKEGGSGFSIRAEVRGYVDVTGEFEHLDDDLL